jgi:hypothetical protein
MACGNSLFRHEQVLCTQCLLELPKTNFHRFPDSPLDKVFWGRVPIERTAAMYYFSKGGKVQHLIHQLKYKGQREVGIYIGKLLGKDLTEEPDFLKIDAIIRFLCISASSGRGAIIRASSLPMDWQNRWDRRRYHLVYPRQGYGNPDEEIAFRQVRKC